MYQRTSDGAIGFSLVFLSIVKRPIDILLY